jgi:chemotaxis protein CheD
MKVPRIVGIGQLAVCHSPEQLSCLGLGSCVAVILYDPQTRVGGMAHVLLPKAPQKVDMEGKYADTGTRKLVKEMTLNGATNDRMIAKLVGGAQMFKNLNVHFANIGRFNVLEVRKTLREFPIRIVAEDVEGDRGRSASLDSATGHVTVKKVFSPTRVM